MEPEFLGCFSVTFPGALEHQKRYFYGRIFQTEIRVPFSSLGGRYLAKGTDSYK